MRATFVGARKNDQIEVEPIKQAIIYIFVQHDYLGAVPEWLTGWT